jgi:diguanylate cyclase (GGDEF)-like protein
VSRHGDSDRDADVRKRALAETTTPAKPGGGEKRRDALPKLGIANFDPESTKIQTSPSTLVSQTKRDRPFLIVIGGVNVGEMYALRQREIIVGRARDATVRFEDDGVSRHHVRITCGDQEVTIEDLHSANGTLVNGNRLVSSRTLADGDKITLGSITILKFTYSDDLDETFQRRMLDASLRDGLTKAYNKSYFLERLDKELTFARRHATALSLVMLDVDHFKKLNDTFGHPAGDAVLVRLSRTVMDALRKEDVFARYGGEEFAVICRGIDGPNACLAAERLRRLIGGLHIDHAGIDLTLTVSMGVAEWQEVKAETPASLVGAADAALYEAKRSGRNRVARADKG